MPRQHGKDGVVKFGPTKEAIGHVQSFTLDESTEGYRTWGMGDTHSAYETTVASFSGSVVWLYDPEDPGATIRARDVVDFEFYPSTDAVGATIWSLTATITSLSRSVTKDGAVEINANFEGSGDITDGTVEA